METVEGVWVGHTTWASFVELVRVWKSYDLRLAHPAVRSVGGGDAPVEGQRFVERDRESALQSASAARRLAARSALLHRSLVQGRVRWSFSSYPGLVASTDDW